MSHNDFNPDSGEFSCQEDGLYSVALMGLMKAEENNPVRVKVMKQVRPYTFFRQPERVATEARFGKPS